MVTIIRMDRVLWECREETCSVVWRGDFLDFLTCIMRVDQTFHM